MTDVLYKQNGEIIINYKETRDEVHDLFRQIEQSFPWFDRSQHVAASTPYIHEIFNETVIRTCFSVIDARQMLGRESIVTAHRMFCMDSKTSFAITTEAPVLEQPEWKHGASWVIARTEHTAEWNRPTPDGFDSFNEYFVCCSPEVAGEHGLMVSDWNEDTLMTVLASDQPLAYRRYTNYDDGDGVLGNWQGIYVMQCKRAKRIDLARELFALNI